MDRMINHMINDWRPERHTKRRSAQRFEVEAEDRVEDGIPRTLRSSLAGSKSESEVGAG